MVVWCVCTAASGCMISSWPACTSTHSCCSHDAVCLYNTKPAGVGALQHSALLAMAATRAGYGCTYLCRGASARDLWMLALWPELRLRMESVRCSKLSTCCFSCNTAVRCSGLPAVATMHVTAACCALLQPLAMQCCATSLLADACSCQVNSKLKMHALWTAPSTEPGVHRTCHFISARSCMAAAKQRC
jgi:hypothetical protein